MNRRWTPALAVVLAMTLAGPALAAGVTERVVSIPGGQAPIYGTLAWPAGTDRVDAVLIVPGSGPVDGDGNAPATNLRTDMFRMLAKDLAEAGFGSLRIDKRFAGRSKAAGPAEIDVTIDLFVDDAARWAAFLAKEPRTRRLFLLGHSQGALVASLVAAKMRPAGLVLVAGAGQPIGRVVRQQIASPSLGFSPMLREEAEKVLRQLERGKTVPEPLLPLMALFRPTVQPFLISWLRHDPVAVLAKLDVPTLVVQGTTDLQLAVQDARRLAQARPGIRLALVEGMNHVLKAAPRAPAASNVATYRDPALPLAPGLMPPIVEFLRETVSAAGGEQK